MSLPQKRIVFSMKRSETEPPHHSGNCLNGTYPPMLPRTNATGSVRLGPPLMFTSQEFEFFNSYSSHPPPFFVAREDRWQKFSNAEKQNPTQLVPSAGQGLSPAPPATDPDLTTKKSLTESNCNGLCGNHDNDNTEKEGPKLSPAPPNTGPHLTTKKSLTESNLEGLCGNHDNDNTEREGPKSSLKQSQFTEFRGYDDRDYAEDESTEDGQIKSESGNTTESDHHQSDNNNEHLKAPIGDKTATTLRLSEVDTRKLTSEQVLFYFGVLALQEEYLQPVFEFTQEAGGRWSARLTMYRDSLKIPSMESLIIAKVEVCRVALSILKVRHGEWRVPDEPSENLSESWLRWKSLLQVYTEGGKWPSPEFTRYVHEKGYRYQIDVGVVTGLGRRKFYVSEDKATEAAAQEVLFLLLSQELRKLSEGSIAPMSRSTVETQPILLSPKVEVRASSSVTATNVANKVPERHRPPDTKRRRVGNRNGTDYMSNLVPVVNPRISMPREHTKTVQPRKWKVPPSALRSIVKNLPTYREKYEKICTVLSLTSRLEIEEDEDAYQSRSSQPYPRPQPQPQTPTSIFSVWATFQNDPFLTRAGAIGKIVGFIGTRTAAKEACCKKVVEYILKMVQEDHDIEQEERRKWTEIENFVDRKTNALKAEGKWNKK